MTRGSDDRYAGLAFTVHDTVNDLEEGSGRDAGTVPCLCVKIDGPQFGRLFNKFPEFRRAGSLHGLYMLLGMGQRQFILRSDSPLRSKEDQ